MECNVLLGLRSRFGTSSAAERWTGGTGPAVAGDWANRVAGMNTMSGSVKMCRETIFWLVVKVVAVMAVQHLPKQQVVTATEGCERTLSRRRVAL